MVTIKNLGWIENMNEMLSAADIVLGKAGPNFLFESIAAKRPFVAITHIGGQEDGNIDLIKYKKLGWVREKPSQLSKFMQDYSKRPGYYHRVFEKFIKAEAERNKESLPKIEKRIKEEFGN